MLPRRERSRICEFSFALRSPIRVASLRVSRRTLVSQRESVSELHRRPSTVSPDRSGQTKSKSWTARSIP